MADPAVLLVEDDEQLSGLLGRLLDEEEYEVTSALDGAAGLQLGLARPFDVMIIDRGLPAVDGLDVLRRLRASGVATPALILTARGTVADRVEGLDSGAEDYVVKPFEVDELLARLRALLRRNEPLSNLTIGTAELDVESRRVIRGSEILGELSARECDLLAILAARPAQIRSREELLGLVFTDAESPGVVDTYVHYLRVKLGRQVIRTVRGLGYRLGTL
jgi:two-component system, OmpR family, response regulator QseB